MVCPFACFLGLVFRETFKDVEAFPANRSLTLVRSRIFGSIGDYNNVLSMDTTGGYALTTSRVAIKSPLTLSATLRINTKAPKNGWNRIIDIESVGATSSKRFIFSRHETTRGDLSLQLVGQPPVVWTNAIPVGAEDGSTWLTFVLTIAHQGSAALCTLYRDGVNLGQKACTQINEPTGQVYIGHIYCLVVFSTCVLFWLLFLF